MTNTTLSLQDRTAYALKYLCDVLKLYCPIRTGNLSKNGILIINDTTIGIGGEVAPYAVYTNEKWEDECWGGKKNPNEGWIQNAINAAMPMITNIFGGELSEEEIKGLIKQSENEFDEQFKSLGNQYLNGEKQ